MSDSLLTLVVVVVEAVESPDNESWYDMDAFRLEATLDRVAIWRPPLAPVLLVGKPDAELPLLLKDRELAPIGRRVVAPPVVLAREEGRPVLVALLSEDDGFVGELGRDDASGRRCCLRGEVVDGVEGLANAIDACAVLEYLDLGHGC